jgi:type IV pilus assembly protein PilY1
VTDYVYAGDLQGNVWRFDLTSSNPAKWAVTSASGTAATSLPGTPIYTTPGGASSPITTEVVVASVAGTPNPRILVEFGTGEQTPFTNLSPATYELTQQYLIGVWDWNLSGNANAWNNISNVQYASLAPGTTPAPPSSALSGTANLEQQSILGTFNAAFGASVTGSQSATNAVFRTVSTNLICWPGSTTCGTGQTATQFGWYLDLSSGQPDSFDVNGLQPPSTGPTAIWEQVVFSPTLADGAFLVNTTIPPTSSLATCSSTTAGGWTMAIDPATGGAFTNSFFGASNHTFLNVDNQVISGMALSGTGTPSVVTAGTSTFLVTQTVPGTGAIAQINPPAASQGSRVTWIEKR